MVRKRIMRAVFGSLVLCSLMCGCGAKTGEALYIGEADGKGEVLFAGETGGENDEVSAGEADGKKTALLTEEADGKNDTAFTGEAAPTGGGETEPPEICVYVCGAVENPGVVWLKEGSRVQDALEASGGFREDAGTDYVNLAARVSDGEKLYFPTADECAEPAVSEGSGGLTSEKDSGLVNINTADADTLCTLPGIGESRAADIIRFRETSGPFESCEDIMKVPGIKTSVYGKIRDLIAVE